jgi:hypothetical protein
MGNKVDCCQYKEEKEHFSKKLFKIYSEKQDNKIAKFIVSHDIELNQSEKIPLPNIITSTRGLGELIYLNNLYLCGGDESFIGSTYFFKYSSDKGLTPLINTIYSHKYPTLIGFNNCIYCIGGLEDNINCERYLLAESRWECFPNLPKSRSGCSAYFDHSTSHFFLFGGYNYISNSMLESIAVIKVSKKTIGHKWEEFLIENSVCIKKSMMGIIPLCERKLLLLAGYEYNNSTHSEELTDDVVLVDLAEKQISKEFYKTALPCSFNDKVSITFSKDVEYLIDENFNLHKFDHKTNSFSSYRLI